MTTPATMPQDPVGIAQLPPHLPDQRTAERLLHIVDQLARTLKQAPLSASPNPQGLQELQAENAMLLRQQATVHARLNALLVRVLASATAAEAPNPTSDPDRPAGQLHESNGA